MLPLRHEQLSPLVYLENDHYQPFRKKDLTPKYSVMAATKTLIPAERIERAILLIRGHKVMLDSNLAMLYGVTTSRLNEQVKRNRKRFPSDFMIQLTSDEISSLRSHFATSNTGRGGRRYRPYAFTEQGVAMLSSVLNSSKAVQVNIEIMRAFVRLRQMLATHEDLARKLTALEKKYDAQFRVVFDAIRQMMAPPDKKKRGIGFLVKEKAAKYGAGGKRRMSPS